MDSLPFEVTGTESEWTDLCYRSRKGKWCRAFPSRTASGIVVLTNQSAWYPHLLLPTIPRSFKLYVCEIIHIGYLNKYQNQAKHSFTQCSPLNFFLLFCTHGCIHVTLKIILRGVFINLNQQSLRLTYDVNKLAAVQRFLSTTKGVIFFQVTINRMTVLAHYDGFNIFEECLRIWKVKSKPRKT